jgi:SAM-dependent methyltransferase
MAPTQAARKLRGAWYTPAELIDVVIDAVMSGFSVNHARAIRVLDPACGDGRFLIAIAARLRDLGGRVELTGCDIDITALDQISDPSVRRIHADALTYEWGDERFDIVIGNPPFLSQMAASTTRGRASRHGGGPYMDAAAEFLALAVRLASPDGGRIGLVLPQSILAARDAGPVREAVSRQADLVWSWWEPKQQHFDASVNVCLLVFHRPVRRSVSQWTWAGVITDRLGIPPIDGSMLSAQGTIGDLAELNANFRDEYYALVPAVSDDADGPPLVTSGLIDPGVCLWGTRSITFAKRSFAAPRVDVSKLAGRFPAWAARKLVPKVLVANQTRIIEAVADPPGAWLPGVPVNTVTPIDPQRVWAIAAVLTSPVASALAWQAGAGTGLSATSVRIGPAMLAAIPWPSGQLTSAIEALRAGDLLECGRATMVAYGFEDHHLTDWWLNHLPGSSRGPLRQDDR